MLIKNKRELKSCVQNNIPCVKLSGSIDDLPGDFSCGLGLECGKIRCPEYEPDQEFWIEEIQDSFK